MKKLKLLALFLTGMVASSFAVAPAYDATNATYQWVLDTTISAVYDFDSVTTAGDTVQILNNYTPQSGWDYIFVHDSLRGGSQDTASIRVVVFSFDGNDSALYLLDVDTLNSSGDGEAIRLPFGGTLFGHRYDVKLIDFGVGNQNWIANVMHIYRRRLEQFKKQF